MSRSVAAAPEGPDRLDHLPRDADGFRLRGTQASRLETFVDAAFAFAVTLLVVSFDAMPASVPELHEALRRAPAFLAGFAILAMFWATHHRFSRRTGLRDARMSTLGLPLDRSPRARAGVLGYDMPSARELARVRAETDAA